ncbi:cation-translocating P-type ATPase [Mycobacterium sp. AMU20-3851]
MIGVIGRAIRGAVDLAAAPLGELVGATPARRCWQGGDRSWIEVRGLDTEQHQFIAAALRRDIGGRAGVRSVQVNYPLSRVIVEVGDDLQSPRLAALCEQVAQIEDRYRNTRSAARPVDLPGDGIVLAEKAIAAAASGIGACAAVAGRALRWPRMPAGLTAVVAVVDYQPRVRAMLEAGLGQQAADTVAAVGAATVYTLTQSPAALAVEFVRHLAQMGEAMAASTAWQAQEPTLARHAECVEAIPATPRPRPVPDGALERYARRCGEAQGAAAAVAGLLTRDPGAATTALGVAVPKAGRCAREAFVSTFGRGLADRCGALPLRSGALRLLDRIDTVVVDPRVLATDELRIGRFRHVADRDRAAVWQWAQARLQTGELTAGWHRVAKDFARDETNGRVGGQVLVCSRHDPLASGVLGEIRRSGASVVSVDLDELDDLRSSFDDLHSADGGLDAALARAVDDLQRDGHTVAVVSADSARALLAADLALGVCHPDSRPPWYADVLVNDLLAVWRIMHALPAARRATERGVELSLGGSALGMLLMVPGVRGQGPGPVTAGAAAGLVTGFWLARRVLLDRPPRPATVEDWHAMTPEQVRRLLPESTVPHADSAEPEKSAGRLGASMRSRTAEMVSALAGELSDPLTPVLAVGSVASAMLGSPVDAILVGSVLAGNAVLAATQQVRAERLLRRLLAVQDPPARRLDGGRAATVAAAALRPGDLIEVRAGEVVPADARIVEATDVEADEAVLTGEPLPVAKQVGATPGAVLADRLCMLYATTTVVTGSAVAVVTEVGSATQARRAVDLGHGAGPTVGLQTQLRDLTDRVLPYSLAGGALVSGLGLVHGLPMRSAVASGVAVAVAAVPEGLPLVATLAQQASARRLTRTGVLVRSPRSVEVLGRVGVVCFDKTGTLSENRLRVTQVRPAGSAVSRQHVLDSAAGATQPRNGAHHEHATDSAIAEAGNPASRPSSGSAYLPFRSGRKFSAAVSEDGLLVKGAPEVVLAACSGLDATTGREVETMARGGLRVIAVARRDLSTARVARARADSGAFAEMCGSRLKLIGLLGLSDTPRPEASQVLKSLQHNAIGVRIITGDHPVTAMATAAELGMPVTAGQVISGEQWEAMPRRAQERAVQDRLVFARMSPEQKVQIVQTLRRTGQVCAMVGDGANDAAAIRAADIGIGVAARGSDPARSSADVLLLDGRIGSLNDAFDEGRQLWRRVHAAVSVLLGGNAGEVVFSVIGSALTGRSPLNTRQLLLVNMMTDALPAAALAVSPARSTDGTTSGPSRGELWRTVAIRGTATAGAATGAWLSAGFVLAPRRASTVALVALVSTQLAQTLIDSRSPLVVATALGSLVSLGALISTPGVSQLLGCTPLDPIGWATALAAAGVATGAAAVAPKLLTALAPGQPPSAQSSMSMTPQRHNTAYTSRNGTVRTRVRASANGRAGTPEPESLTPATVGNRGVQKPKPT